MQQSSEVQVELERMKNELKAHAQTKGEQSNLVDTRLFLEKIKDI